MYKLTVILTGVGFILMLTLLFYKSLKLSQITSLIWIANSIICHLIIYRNWNTIKKDLLI